MQPTSNATNTTNQQLTLRNVTWRTESSSDTIDVSRVMAFMARLGVDIKLVDIVEGETPDGKLQCSSCLELKDRDLFRYQGKPDGGFSTLSTCKPCRTQYGYSWNRGRKKA